MPNEASKLRERWQREGIWERYFRPNGSVIDIGAGADPIVPWARSFDVPDGDAQYVRSEPTEGYDVVFSAHCLEHMRDPREALAHWWRLVKPEGYLIFEIPDEDLYEQGTWPSRFNPDHKHTFTIFKDRSWSPVTCTTVNLVSSLPNVKVISMRTIGPDAGELIRDTTQQPRGEATIEVVLQKCTIQYELMTHLRHLYRCPKCHRNSLLVRGETHDGRLEFLCNACGVVGTIKTDFSTSQES